MASFIERFRKITKICKLLSYQLENLNPRLSTISQNILSSYITHPQGSFLITTFAVLLLFICYSIKIYRPGTCYAILFVHTTAILAVCHTVHNIPFEVIFGLNVQETLCNAVWCRRTDELVDGPNASHITPKALERWEKRLTDLFEGRPYDMYDAALSDTVSKYPVDIQVNLT